MFLKVLTELFVFTLRDEWPFALIMSIISFVLSLITASKYAAYIKNWLNDYNNSLHSNSKFSNKYITGLLLYGKGISDSVVVIIVAFSVAFLVHKFLTLFRNYICHVILSHHCWMQERSSKSGLVWWQMCAVKLFTSTMGQTTGSPCPNMDLTLEMKTLEDDQRKAGFKSILETSVITQYPQLYTYQRVLPNLPLPSLESTLKRLKQSLEPCTGQELPHLWENRLMEFEKGIGRLLQALLKVRQSLLTDNYISDWWERYVYCMSRKPLVINSNYYILDMSHYTPTSIQSARAATLLYHFLKFRQLILNQTLASIKVLGRVPVCMEQYRRIFSTVRLPGDNVDYIVHYEPHESQHVVVYCRGTYYSVPVASKKMSRSIMTLDSTNPVSFIPLESFKLQGILEEILQDSKLNANSHMPSYVPKLNALTALPRDEWAKCRKLHFSSGINQQSLKAIESAILVLVLETDVEAKRGEYATEGRYLLGGRACWHDKSINLVIFGNGRMGLHCEHSYADAPVVAHAHEYALSSEYVNDSYDDVGNCKKSEVEINDGNSPDGIIQRLEWDLSEVVEEKLDKATQYAQQKRDEVDLCIQDFSFFGKGAMKRHQMSPDAFVQIAVQMAYFKLHGTFALTYEASATRLYLKGRTETVRSLTREVADFIRAYEDDSVSRMEKIELLKSAAKRHQSLYKDAMTGKGCDRHLFALYVMSKMIGQESDILRDILSMPWTLSTSQSPQRQIKTNIEFDAPNFQHKLSPGGGFGPVTANGYGVAYMFPSNNKLFFHVSSFKSTVKDKCDSSKFCQQIFQSLRQLLALLEPHETH